MAVDLCYIISHGFASRMLLQTGLINKLIDTGLSVALVSPDKSDPNLQKLSQNQDITLVEWNGKTTIWDDDYLHKRMYFLEDILNNTALLEKFYNGLFFSKSKHPWKRIRPLFYFIVYLLIPYFPFLRKRFQTNEGKYLDSKEGRQILEELNPKLLVSTYPVSIIEAKLLHEAKKKNIRTGLHLLSWDNITCKGKFPIVGDFFIAWGEIMKEELQEHYEISAADIEICGVPHFDEHIKSKNNSLNSMPVSNLGLNPDHPYLFFAMSSPRFAPREIDIVCKMASIVEANVFGEKMQIIIRPHPQNVTTYMANRSWLERLNGISSDRVGIDYPKLNKSKIRWSMQQEDMKNLSSLIAGCTVCFNSGSTVSIDALMHNKPVIITAFDGTKKNTYWNSARRLIDYPHLKKFIAEGGATPVTSYDQLIERTANFIGDANYNISNRRNALLQECFSDDGQSTVRVVECLAKNLNNARCN